MMCSFMDAFLKPGAGLYFQRLKCFTYSSPNHLSHCLVCLCPSMAASRTTAAGLLWSNDVCRHRCLGSLSVTLSARVPNPHSPKQQFSCSHSVCLNHGAQFLKCFSNGRVKNVRGSMGKKVHITSADQAYLSH